MAKVYIFVCLFFVFFDLLQCYDINFPKPIISPECELEGICDNVENYPTNLVQELIERLQSQNTTFNYDEAPLPRMHLNNYSNNRFSHRKHLKLCETKPRFVIAKAARDQNGIWQYIINDSQEPIQVFRTEICSIRIGRCSKKITFGLGYDGACIQKTFLREMFYVNEENEIGVNHFEVPTSCSCSLFRKNDDK